MATIRSFNNDTDSAGLRDCMIELQNFERELDSRLQDGAQIADAYVAEMHQRCRESHGDILVADVDGEVAGYAMILCRAQSNEIIDGNLEYGLVTDLVIRKPYRGTGLGKQLLQAAEDHARANDVRWLRISVLADNHGARKMYSNAGFADLYLELEKELGEA